MRFVNSSSNHKPMKTKTDKRWLHLNAIQGYIAMWAVRQSPYHSPDGILEVLNAFRLNAAPLFDKHDMAQMSRPDVEKLLKDSLLRIPEFQKWNERRNGDQRPFGFCSRYDHPSPDDDFINLGALIRNVAMDLFRELDRDYEFDQQFDKEWRRGWLKRWWFGFKQRLFPMTPATPGIPGAATVPPNSGPV